ncbi:MAG: hypothetical protein WC979_07905 [Candidatus Pacearchaeota archaeon]|jgi:hypothetical protein
MTVNEFQERTRVITSGANDIVKNILKILLSPFFDKDDTFSWKKCMTAAVTFCFIYAVIGFLNKHNFDVLPTKYLYVIFGVFIAYFGKDIPDSFLQVIGKYFDSKKINNTNDILIK